MALAMKAWVFIRDLSRSVIATHNVGFLLFFLSFPPLVLFLVGSPCRLSTKIVGFQAAAPTGDGWDQLERAFRDQLQRPQLKCGFGGHSAAGMPRPRPAEMRLSGPTGMWLPGLEWPFELVFPRFCLGAVPGALLGRVYFPPPKVQRDAG
jgi:hypothetical protein